MKEKRQHWYIVYELGFSTATTTNETKWKQWRKNVQKHITDRVDRVKGWGKSESERASDSNEIKEKQAYKHLQ